jgi:formylglycine-generating enzyme required for sulfatase activity
MISLRHFIGFIGWIGIVSCASKATENTSQELAFSPHTTKNGMVWVSGGELTMGSDDPGAYAAERPAVKVTVAGFWIEPTEVSNAQFQKFVTAT